MQVCTSLQTNNHTSTQPLSFLQAGCPSCCPTNSVKALKALQMTKCHEVRKYTYFLGKLNNFWQYRKAEHSYTITTDKFSVCGCDGPVLCTKLWLNNLQRKTIYKIYKHELLSYDEVLKTTYPQENAINLFLTRKCTTYRSWLSEIHIAKWSDVNWKTINYATILNKWHQ